MLSRQTATSSGVTLLLGVFMLAAPVVAAQQSYAGEPCSPHWDNAAGQPGVNLVIFALEVFDDGSGLDLYAGGLTSASNDVIARWNGSEWSALGQGLGGDIAIVRDLSVFDDGTGPALYVGGGFRAANGAPGNHIARWDGSQWSALGEGVSESAGSVDALAVFDTGNGPALYVGGQFQSAGGVAASNIARWDGTAWTAVGAGLNGFVNDLLVFDDGNVPALYAATVLTSERGPHLSVVLKWDGTSWSQVGEPFAGVVTAFAEFNAGAGSLLYACGTFDQVGGQRAKFIARWDGATWSPLEGELSGGEGVVTLAVFDDGAGSALYAGGSFTMAGDTTVNHIAKWNGEAWSAVDGGVDGELPYVLASEVFDDDTGPALFVAGLFEFADGEQTRNIATRRGCGPSACLGDFVDATSLHESPDGIVDAADLAYLLGEWGRNPGSLADMVDSATFQPPPDGVVDAADLAFLLGAWGRCE